MQPFAYASPSKPFRPLGDARFKDPRVEPDRNIRLLVGIPRPGRPLTGSMAARRLLAALIAAAVSAGSLLAACELFCATDCARAAAVPAPVSDCHGHGEQRTPQGERGCPGAHMARLAVRDAGSTFSIAVAPPAFLPARAMELPARAVLPGARTVRDLLSSSASPPPILRV